MLDPTASAGTALKNLVKDPLFYVIAIFVLVGAYLMHDSKVDPTWGVGAGCIVFGAIMLIAQFFAAIYDGSFRRRYNDVFTAQGKTIKNQSRVIDSLSKHTVDAHSGLSTQPSQIAGGYEPDTRASTSTGNSSYK